MMDVLEAIFTRRSVRAFTNQPLEAEALRQVLQAGMAAPSGGNLQAWGFVVVQSPKRLAGLRSLAPGIIGEPAAVIAICLDEERARRLGGTGSEHLARLDIGLATQNMLLAAHALGWGACPIGSFHPQAVSLFLGLPEGVQPILLLALGVPKVKPTPPGRRPPAEIIFTERWGQPYEG
jgi:nitroreductase